jgi:GT2 family glycosyltransferase
MAKADGSIKLTINPEMNRRTDLSIIIVNHNTKELLLNCLSSIEKSQNHLEKEIFVVDNASTDESIKVIQNSKVNSQNLKIITNKINLGFAKACNQAIRRAKGRYILLLNPDTVLEKNTLLEMISFMDKNPKIGVSTCRVELPNGEIDWASHRGFPTPWRSFVYFSRFAKLFPSSKIFGGYHLEYENFKKPHEIDSPCGAFYLVRKEAVKKVGLLDEDYFMFAEDLDWSYRIKQAGYKIFYYPKVKIIHYKGAASGMHKVESQAEKKERKKAVKSFYETMKIFYQKHYEDKYPKWVKFLVFLGIDFLKRRRITKLGLD